jgi:hypothetical protein
VRESVESVESLLDPKLRELEDSMNNMNLTEGAKELYREAYREAQRDVEKRLSIEDFESLAIIGMHTIT